MKNTVLNKVLVMLIVFMMLFSTFGYTLAAIADSDEFKEISAGFFQKDPVKFNAYFVDSNGNETDSITANVNEKVKLVLELTPQIEGYLKTGLIKAVPNDSESDHINFKFISVTENLLEEDSVEGEDEALQSISQNEEQIENTIEDVFQTENTVEEIVPEENTNVIANEVVAEEETNTITSNIQDAFSNPLMTTSDEALQATGGNETENGANPLASAIGESQEVVEDNSNVVEPKEQVVDDDGDIIIDDENYVDEDALINEDKVAEEELEEALYQEEIKNALIDIYVSSDNEIKLSNILVDTKVEVELEFNQQETLDIEDLNKMIDLQLTGKFINRKLEEVEIGKKEEINVIWEYSKDVEITSEYTKISPFELEDIKGTIVEDKITVNRDIEDEHYLPIKSTRFEINVPTINGNYPSTVDIHVNSLLATRGEDIGQTTFDQTNWNYDNLNGKINILVENENRNFTNGIDEYVITYRYDDYIEEEIYNLPNNLRATITEYSGIDNNEIIKDINDNKDIKVDVGELITYDIGSSIEKINKAKIYANYNSDEPVYETTFENQVNVNILTSDVLEQLLIDASKDYYITPTGVEIEATDVEYKEIIFNYNELTSLLENGGRIVITNVDGETLYTLTKEILTNENDCAINLNYTKGIYINAYDIANNGVLNFEIVKAIRKSNLDKATFKGISKIESRLTSKVKYSKVDDILTLKTIGTSKEFEESVTEANLVINRSEFSTLKTNANVEFKIELNNDKENSDMYVNPDFEIVFPKYVTSATINSVNVINKCGLSLNTYETYVENDIVRLKVSLEGKEQEFSENTLTNGTNIIINADLELNDYTPVKDDQIKLYYCNEGVATYNAQTKWNIDKQIPSNILKLTNGFDVEVIHYQAPDGLLAVNGFVNYDGNLSSLQSVKQGEVTANIPINSSSKIVTMELLALNNTSNTCSNITLLGRVPTKDLKNIITGEALNTTVDTTMLSGISEDIQNGNTVSIYYSENINATKDLQDENNGWIQNIESYANIKSFMIVVKGDVEAGASLRFTYDFEIPENLAYEAKVAGAFASYYNNNTDVATVYETDYADTVALITEKGPQIDTKITNNLETAGEVNQGGIIEYTLEVSNTGSIPAENVIVSIPKPTYGNFTELVKDDSNLYFYYKKLNDVSLDKAIGTLNPGEKSELTFMIRVGTPYTIKAMSGSNENVPEEYSADEFYIELNLRIKIDNLSIDRNIELDKTLIKNNNFNFETSFYKIGMLCVGDVITYKYTVSNISSVNKENVNILFSVPEEFELSKITVSNNGEIIDTTYNEETRTVTATVNTFEANRTINISVSMELMRYLNKKFAPELSFECEGNTEKSYSIYPEVSGCPVIEGSLIDKFDANTIEENEAVTYTYMIKNTGNMEANNIKLIVNPSENLNNVVLKIDGATLDLNTNEYNIGSIKDGNSRIITLSGNAKEVGNGTLTITNEFKIIYNDTTVNDVKTDALLIVKKENTEVVEEQGQQYKFEEGSSYYYETNVNTDATPISSNDTNGTSTVNNTTTNANSTTETPTYEISGYIWKDVDGNRIKDDEEISLSSIKVELLKSGNVIQTTKTGTNGTYKFNNVANGKYTVAYTYDGEKYTILNNDSFVETETGKAVSIEIAVNNNSLTNVNLGLEPKDTFNLNINKYISKVTTKIGSDTEEFDFDNLSLAKVEIPAKKLNNSQVTLEYKIIVENIGDVEGYATMINDVLPTGTEFDISLNNGWYLGNDDMLYNETLEGKLIKPGEKVELSLILTKQMTEENTGVVSNKVLLANTRNDLGLKDDTSDNVNTQEVLILVKTGYTSQVIVGIIISLIVLLLLISSARFVNTDKKYKNKESFFKKFSLKKNYK